MRDSSASVPRRPERVNKEPGQLATNRQGDRQCLEKAAGPAAKRQRVEADVGEQVGEQGRPQPARDGPGQEANPAPVRRGSGTVGRGRRIEGPEKPMAKRQRRVAAIPAGTEQLSPADLEATTSRHAHRRPQTP